MSPLPFYFSIIRCYQVIKKNENGASDEVSRQNEIQTMLLCNAKKMIVGRHYCYKGKGIYSGTCSMKYGHFPNVMQVKPCALNRA